MGESLWMMLHVGAMKRHQNKVEALAYHDALTGLPNRMLLIDRLQQALAAAERAPPRGRFFGDRIPRPTTSAAERHAFEGEALDAHLPTATDTRIFSSYFNAKAAPSLRWWAGCFASALGWRIAGRTLQHAPAFTLQVLELPAMHGPTEQADQRQHEQHRQRQQEVEAFHAKAVVVEKDGAVNAPGATR